MRKDSPAYKRAVEIVNSAWNETSKNNTIIRSCRSSLIAPLEGLVKRINTYRIKVDKYNI